LYYVCNRFVDVALLHHTFPAGTHTHSTLQLCADAAGPQQNTCNVIAQQFVLVQLQGGDGTTDGIKMCKFASDGGLCT